MGPWLRATFFAAGIAGLAWASWGTAGSAVLLPPGQTLALAAALMTVSLCAAAAAWVWLLPAPRSRRRLVRGFVAAQLGKYIPGGVWLAVGQAGFAADAGIPLARATGALGVCAVAMAAAAGAAAGSLGLVLLAADGHVDGRLLALALPGLLLPLLLDRRWMTSVARRVASWRRVPRGGVVIPAQREILRSFCGFLIALTAMAVAYAILLQSLGGGESIVRTMCIFTVAWLAGFLAVGVPSGIGAREAVLVLLLPDATPVVLAASIAQRLVQMVAEVGVVLATRDWRAAGGAASAWIRARLHLLPNAISAFRVALVPILWVLALRGEPHWVAMGLVAAGLSDLADGHLARRLHATSRFGAQLDSVGDNLLALSGVAWLVLLRPDIVAQFLLPLQALLALYLVFLAVGWLKFHRFANLHLYSGKLSAVFLYAFLLHSLWFPTVSAPLFHAMWAVTALALAEGLAYQLISRTVTEDAGSLALVLWERRSRASGRAATGSAGSGERAA